MTMSVSKMKETTSNNITGQLTTIKTGEYKFETIDNFSYLGSQIKTDSSYENEICPMLLKELLLAKKKLFCLKPLDISHLRAYSLCIPPQTCVHRKNYKLLAAFEKRILRRIFGPYVRVENSVAYIRTKYISETTTAVVNKIRFNRL